LLAACSQGGAREADAVALPATCDDATTLDFVVDFESSESEQYVCFGFDAAALQGRSLQAIRWAPPRQGGIVLHHATLYATAEVWQPAAGACDAMPSDAAGLHVWAPGGTSLEMPAGIALSLPEGTRTLIVEAHALRVGAGASENAHCELCPSTALERAAWLGVQAPVPAMRPHYVETSTAQCKVPADLHVLFTWPHMHRIGKEFHGAIVRANGTREPLVNVVPWDFDQQRTYPVDATLQQNDAIETNCVWENPTDEYVLPGPLTTDEMCNQGIIGHPATSAHCLPQ
jgi:hypothetical protein